MRRARSSRAILREERRLGELWDDRVGVDPGPVGAVRAHSRRSGHDSTAADETHRLAVQQRIYSDSMQRQVCSAGTFFEDLDERRPRSHGVWQWDHAFAIADTRSTHVTIAPSLRHSTSTRSLQWSYLRRDVGRAGRCRSGAGESAPMGQNLNRCAQLAHTAAIEHGRRKSAARHRRSRRVGEEALSLPSRR